jgi:hypothetical protein
MEMLRFTVSVRACSYIVINCKVTRPDFHYQTLNQIRVQRRIAQFAVSVAFLWLQQEST